MPIALASPITVISILVNLCFLGVGLYVIYRLGGVQATIARVFRRREEDLHWLARESLFQSQTPSSESVTMVGDSLTEMADWSELFGRPVLNRGISGDTSAGILKRLKTITKPCPRSIFIMAGSNDLFGDGISANEIADNIFAILNEIRSSCPQTKVYLQSILPVSRERANGIDLCSANAMLASLADGRAVIFVDLFSRFEQNGYLKQEQTFDGVHLNGSGYLIWRDAIAPLLSL